MADYSGEFTGQQQYPGFSFAGLFNNPNFQNVLAQLGAGLDPHGVGGVLGAATQAFVKAKAAQSATESQEAERQQYNQQLLSILAGRMTPQGQPGVTGMKLGPDGTLKLEANLPGTIPSSQGWNPQSPASGLQFQGAPAAQPTVPAPAIPGTPAPPPQTRLDQPLGADPAMSRLYSRLSDLSPFFSRPAGSRMGALLG